MSGVVKADPLFVGLTRPPLLFGVSYTFAILNGMVGMLGYISSSDIRYLIVIAPIHAVGYYLCSKEPLFIDLFKVKLEKCSKSRNKIYHGANSYDAF